MLLPLPSPAISGAIVSHYSPSEQGTTCTLALQKLNAQEKKVVWYRGFGALYCM